jgi:beta-lactamase superfamily II metal-dependent hydrolase
MLKSVTDTINTAFFLKDGETVLALDGGFASETESLYEAYLEQGGAVDAWFLTHLHNDHVEALLKLLESDRALRIGGVYWNFPSDAFFEAYDPMQGPYRSVELIERFKAALAARSIPLHVVRAGQVLTFGGVTVRVLRTPDESIVEDPVNNSSIVLRVEAAGTSLLFLGDLAKKGGEQLLKTVDGALLRADYVQMSHHGQKGVDRTVYEAIRPRYCLWCTPSWLWDNVGANGYDTGPYETVIVRGWMSALGCVEKHYRMFDGTQDIELG